MGAFGPHVVGVQTETTPGNQRSETTPKEYAMTIKMRFEATCTCGTRITGDTRKWRHDSKPADGHKAHAIGTLRQI